MNEHTDRRRMAAPTRIALTSLLVASGIGVVGVVPALAANNTPVPAAFHSDHDRDRGHDRWFRDRGDVRYVWFRVCDTTAIGATATTTDPAAATTTTDPAATTAETIAPDAIAAAVEGAAVETATATDTVTTDTLTTEAPPTETAPVADDDPDAEAYPTFVVVPLPKDEAKALRKLDERPCYDLTTGAPRGTDATTTTDAVTPDTPLPVETTTTAAPVGTVTG
jgi:hypothetical protein